MLAIFHQVNFLFKRISFHLEKKIMRRSNATINTNVLFMRMVVVGICVMRVNCRMIVLYLLTHVSNKHMSVIHNITLYITYI